MPLKRENFAANNEEHRELAQKLWNDLPMRDRAIVRNAGKTKVVRHEGVPFHFSFIGGKLIARTHVTYNSELKD